jgi:5-methylcytosine-specific restriction endonuclease McrA
MPYKDPADRKAWRERNRERVRTYFREWQHEQRAVGGPHAQRQRAHAASYKKRRREHYTELQRLRDARKLENYVEDVHRLVVLERADGICGICGEDVDPLNFHVDHIEPLARGGEHSYANTQPAHPPCNQRKYDKELG